MGFSVRPLSLHGFQEALTLKHADAGFYALVMAAMLKADSTNIARLREAFPGVWSELVIRYSSPGGHHPDDDPRGDR